MTEPAPPSPDSQPPAIVGRPVKTVHVRPTGKLKRYMAPRTAEAPLDAARHHPSLRGKGRIERRLRAQHRAAGRQGSRRNRLPLHYPTNSSLPYADADADAPPIPLPRCARALPALWESGRGMCGQPADALHADPRTRGIPRGRAGGAAPERDYA
jgi:hypothetical protein